MKTILSTAILLLSFNLFGQNPSRIVTETNPDLGDDVGYVFETLDLTPVTSGILLERGFPMRDVSRFDGSATTDTLASYTDWFLQYGTMVTSVVDATKSIGTTSDWKAETDSLSKMGILPIMAMHLNYHELLKDTIQLANLIYASGGQLYDYPSQSQSPFQSGEVFSFAPKNSVVKDSLSWRFRLDGDYFITNTAKTISTVEMDFDDGRGYNVLTVPSTTNISWTTYGTKYLKLKVTYTDNSVYHATSQLHIKGSHTPKHNADYDFSKYIVNPTYSNYSAHLRVSLGCGNTKITKPYIYVEGFNPELFENTYAGLIDNLDLYQGDFGGGYQLLDELNENGYDIIYVDFRNGKGDLTLNAETVAEAIKWVNEQKEENCSTKPNILVGYSMGGVVSRLALTYLEDEGYHHQVSKYVSVDAPHLGANIPESIIVAFLDMYQLTYTDFDVTEDVPILEDLIDILYSPAARQMLIYGEGPSQYADLQNELAAQGMPQGYPQDGEPIENIAIAKGNGDGNSQGTWGGLEPLFDFTLNLNNISSCEDEFLDYFGVDPSINFSDAWWLIAPITQLVDWEWTDFTGPGLWAFGFRLNIDVDLNIGPGYTSDPYEIYHRKIRVRVPFVTNINTGELSVKVANRRFYDGAQGSNIGVNSISALGAGAPAEMDGLITDLMNGTFDPCLALHLADFCFIPTVSALNIQSLMASPNTPINTEDIVTNNQTTFDKAFVLDDTKYPNPSMAPSNESHLALTPSNIFPFEDIIGAEYEPDAGISTLTANTVNYGFNDTDPNDIKTTTDRISGAIALSGSSFPGGAICINCAGNINVLDDNSYPLNTASDFEVRLSGDCDEDWGRLTINNNGIIRVGEDDNQTGRLIVYDGSWIEMNDGLLEVRPGSELIIDSGAELRLNGGYLRVMDGGKVTIKEGGLLIYEDGVNLELNGNDAQLALGGHTHIGDNATFQFFWQGSESGYVRLLEEGHWGQRFSAGTNASVRLEGAGKDDLILYMEKDADFWEYSQSDNFQDHGLTSEDFASVLFKDGNIVCEKGSRFVFKAKTAFADVKIEQFSSLVGDRPRGIVTYAQLNFHQSDADRIDIEGKFNVSGHGYLKFQSSTFERSNISIRGGSFDFASSSFERLTIEEEETVHTSRFTSSHMTGVTSKIISKSHQELRIVGSSISDFAFGVEKHKGQLTVRCSEFKGNYGHDAISLFQNAQLNMSLRTGGGYNYFENNKGHIMVDYSTFFISLGYNTFYDDPDNNHVEATYISGRVGYMPGTDESDYLISTVHNAWTPHGQSPNPAWPDPDKFEIEVWEPVQGNGMVMFYVPFDFGQVMPPTECGLYDYPADPPPVEGPKNGDENTFSSQTAPLMSGTVYFDGLQFDDALQTVSNLLIEADTTESDLGLIADMYYDLLSSVPDCNEPESACKSLNQMCFEALNGYKSIVEILFKEEELTIDENQASFQPTVANYVSTLMAFTDSVKTPENHAKQYDLEMMKVSLFRGIQKYDQALSILVNMEQCEHDSIREVIIDSQIQNILFDQHVHSEGVSYDLENESSFQLDSSLFHLYAQSIIDTSGFGSYITGPNNVMFTHCEVPTTAKSKTVKYEQELVEIFPNPTKGEVQVRLNIPDFLNDDAVYVMTLHDLAGRMVFSELIRSTEQQVVLPNLQRSIYISSISRGDERIFRGKLTVM